MNWKDKFPKGNRYFETDSGILYNGNVIDIIKRIPDASIDCVVTSPPYWALRDYGVKEQLGLEPTFREYLEKLWFIFDEVYRVLKPTGTCWVNLGDTYAGSGKGAGYKGVSKESWHFGKRPKIKESVPEKSLCMIPERFVIGMIDRGWILRNEIIWHKPNAMPSSVKDRFTVDFEKIFFFVKNKRYYFEQQFELHKSKPHGGQMGAKSEDTHVQYDVGDVSRFYKPQGRNKRAVWSINTKPFKEAHFAVYPEELIETPIKAGCPKQVCRKCGQPISYRKISIGWIDNPSVEGAQIENTKPYAIKEREGYIGIRNLPPLKDIQDYLNRARKKKGLTIEEVEERLQTQSPHHWFNGESYPSRDDWLKIKMLLDLDNTYDSQMTEVKYKPAEKLKSRYKTIKTSCNCDAGFEGGLVLDAFMGSGTTAFVSERLGRRWIGIELNPDYCEIAKRRVSYVARQNKLNKWLKC